MRPEQLRAQLGGVGQRDAQEPRDERPAEHPGGEVPGGALHDSSRAGLGVPVGGRWLATAEAPPGRGAARRLHDNSNTALATPSAKGWW
ncbi:hypothetical protein GCM10017566_08330 [Amycolatopsis bartoniae]|uniref:Uncharacterized protein n=1 Tax=Amycolatopsis bartoniae TaxID=941986 RepID=A0A8H9MBR8_9PSEU|nr:hypothetical protein GCM10017566_08330 [Amycolatopsis bartoniae]